MSGKRKSSGGGGDGLMTRRKRKTATATALTASEQVPPNSDMDAEPHVEGFMIKEEPEPEVDSEWDAETGFFGESSDQLTSEIDIGEVNVKVLTHPEGEGEGMDEGDSNMSQKPSTSSIAPKTGGTVHVAASSSKSLEEWRVINTECGNKTGASGGGETHEPSPSSATDTKGNHNLQREMSGERNGASKSPDENVGLDEVAGTTGSQQLMEGSPTDKGTRKMLPSDKKDVSTNLDSAYETEGESDEEIARLTTEYRLLEEEVALLKNANSEKDGVLQSHSNEIRDLKGKVKQLETEKQYLTSYVIRRQASETKRLQDDNADLKGLIKEKEKELAEFKAKHFRDEGGNFQLHLAVSKGDEQAIKNLLQLGAGINARNANSETPIVLAVTSKLDGEVSLRIVKYFIEQEADVFATDKEGQTFLHKLASPKSPLTPAQFHEMAEYLISKNLQRLFNIRDTCPGTTPLMLATAHVTLQPETVSLLHANGVDFTLRDNRNKSVLFYATEGHKNQKLLSRTIKPEEAIGAADEDLVKLLVRLGAGLNEMDSNYETPLHYAAKSKDKTFAISIIKFLISSGAKVDGKDQQPTFLHRLLAGDEHAPLSPAQFHDLVTFLDSKGLCRLLSTPGNASNSTPFQFAVARLEIQTGTLALLKSQNVDFNQVDGNGESLLFYATWGNRTLQFITEIVRLGANPKKLNMFGENLLHVAARNGNVELLEYFLGKRLNINGRNKGGDTPLHQAIYAYPKENVFKTVQFLLRNGAGMNFADNKGKSPLGYFVEYRDFLPDADRISTCFELGSSC